MLNQFFFLYGRGWPNFSKKWECEIWIMFYLHDYKIILLIQFSALLCSLLFIIFFFSVLLLLAIVLMKYLCPWDCTLNTASLNYRSICQKKQEFPVWFLL